MHKYSRSVQKCPFGATTRLAHSRVRDRWKKSHETVPLLKPFFTAHLSGILPLCGLGDMVHEVDLSVVGLRHLPAG
jgi:hypothetical protein